MNIRFNKMSIKNNSILQWGIGILISIIILFVGGFAGWVVKNIDEFPVKYVLTSEYNKDIKELNIRIENAIIEQRAAQQSLQTNTEDNFKEIRNYLIEIFKALPTTISQE